MNERHPPRARTRAISAPILPPPTITAWVMFAGADMRSEHGVQPMQVSEDPAIRRRDEPDGVMLFFRWLTQGLCLPTQANREFAVVTRDSMTPRD